MTKMMIAIVAMTISLHAQAQGLTETVHVTNLEKKAGTLYIGWYNNAGDFGKKEKAVFYKSVKVSGEEEVKILFEKIPSGTYAIAMFLDENNNGELDKNFFGVPKEKYGFSNNVMPSTRAAKFEEAAFTIAASQEINIKLK